MKIPHNFPKSDHWETEGPSSYSYHHMINHKTYEFIELCVLGSCSGETTAGGSDGISGGLGLDGDVCEFAVVGGAVGVDELKHDGVHVGVVPGLVGDGALAMEPWLDEREVV